MSNKIGEKALIAIKETNKQVEVFKKPKELPKKKKHIILTEEKYVEVNMKTKINFVTFVKFPCNFLGTGQNYPKRFLPGLGEAEGSK